MLQLQAVPQLQAVLQLQQELLAAPDGAADTTTPAPTTAGSSTGDPAHLSEAFAWLLAEGGGLQVCPSEAVARITFQAVCYGSKGLSLAAFNRFMAWCGEPEIVAGERRWTDGVLCWVYVGACAASVQQQTLTQDVFLRLHQRCILGIPQ